MGRNKSRIADAMLAERGPRGIPYSVYLKTGHWRGLRFRILRLDGKRCVWCGQGGTCVHHRTYDRLGCERDTDLVTLCAECHQKVHSGILPIDRPRRKPKKKKRKDKQAREQEVGRQRKHIERRVGNFYVKILNKYRKSSHDSELVVVRRALLGEDFLSAFRKRVEAQLQAREGELAAEYQTKP